MSAAAASVSPYRHSNRLMPLRHKRPQPKRRLRALRARNEARIAVSAMEMLSRVTGIQHRGSQGPVAQGGPNRRPGQNGNQNPNQHHHQKPGNNSQNPPIASATPPPPRHDWHDGDWYRRHSRVIVIVVGSYYYWDAGYWYPAYGYDPTSYYPSDDPIYAYGNLLPDQVIANVQRQLNLYGYYTGAITGSLDSTTRAAIANYQRDNGLLVTGTVDQSTVESLGLV
jgi:putative peptidoglycan binding protein